MNRRATLILFVLTVLTMAGAVRAVLTSPEAGPVAQGEIAFPLLRAAPDSTRELTVTTGDGVYRFRRHPDSPGWIAVDRHGYPASGDRIGTIIARLADMRLVEAKTRMPERFRRIGLEAPDTQDSTSVLLQLRDGEGRELAAVILGGRVWRRTGPAPNGTFVRFPDRDQAWLASGGVDVPGDPVDWLDRTIVDIPPESVAQVMIAGNGVPGIEISRTSAPEPFVRSEGGEVSAEQTRRIAAGLSGLGFDDVAPADGGPGEGTAVTVTTFDGLSVRLVLSGEEKDEAWVRRTASGKGEAAEAHAREISARVGPWRYRIPDWQRDRLVSDRKSSGDSEIGHN